LKVIGSMKQLSPNHTRYFESINKYKGVTVAIGPAGTGKTHIACTIGIEKLLRCDIEKIVITRPAVNVDECHGFLPGTANSKMVPYLIPIYDSFLTRITKHQLKKYIDDSKIEVSPLAYMRGRTFHKSFIIADEAQNTTPSQMKMLLTRLGEETKLVVTGDVEQSDLRRNNGLADLMLRIEERFQYTDEVPIDIVKFGRDDVLRSKLVEDILELYANEVPKVNAFFL